MNTEILQQDVQQLLEHFSKNMYKAKENEQGSLVTISSLIYTSSPLVRDKNVLTVCPITMSCFLVMNFPNSVDQNDKQSIFYAFTH